MKKKGKYSSLMLLLILFLVLNMLPNNFSHAVKKVNLSTKKLSLTVKKTKTLKLRNNKKKVKWSITSGKRFIKLKSKKKTSVKVIGKKAGKAKIQAKVGKKKYVCKVTVKKGKVTPKPNPTKKLTPNPTASPTATPILEREIVALELSADRDMLFEDSQSDKDLLEKYPTTWLSYHYISLNIKIVYKNANEIITNVEAIPSGMVISYKDGKLIVKYREKEASLKVEYAKAQMEGKYSYITNGKVSHITGYSGKNEGSVVIPDSMGGAPVTQIDGWDTSLSSWNVNISELTLPKELNDLRSYEEWCEWVSLKSICTKEGAKNLKAVDGVLFNKKFNTLEVYPKAKEDEYYTVPATVTTIRNNAFSGNTHMKKLELPSALSTIGNKLSTYGESDPIEFWISNLEEILVASNNPYITSVDGVLYDKKVGIMRYCPPGRKKRTLEVPEGVRIIAHYAMQGVAIDELILPTTLKTFEYQSHDGEGSDYVLSTHIFIKKNCLTKEEWYDLWYYGMDNLYNTVFHVKSQKMYDFLKSVWDDSDSPFPNKISKDYNW